MKKELLVVCVVFLDLLGMTIFVACASKKPQKYNGSFVFKNCTIKDNDPRACVCDNPMISKQRDAKGNMVTVLYCGGDLHYDRDSNGKEKKQSSKDSD